METKIVKEKIASSELKALAHEQYGDIIKVVVDIGQGIMGVGGELHVDIQSICQAVHLIRIVLVQVLVSLH